VKSSSVSLVLEQRVVMGGAKNDNKLSMWFVLANESGLDRMYYEFLTK
jgi:hypothetical protein